MPKPKQTLNVALIGPGFIGRIHSNAFHQVGRFFDTAYKMHPKVVCGRDRTKLAAMASQWGWEEIATDWQAIVNRPDIQVVDIAVPNALHAPIAIAAAQAGKIVWCEKPLAMSLAEAESMAKAASKVPTLAWFNYRRVPAVALAKQLIDEGRIGQPFHYRALYLNQSGTDPAKTSGWRYNRADSGSGAIGDLLSHSIDLALHMNGAITELSATTQTFSPDRDVDDAVLVMARFSNGSTGSFEASRFGVGSRNRNSFEINGAGGMLRFTLEDMNRLDFYDATEVAAVQGVRSIQVGRPGHPYGQNFWKAGHAVGFEHTFIATVGDFLEAMTRDVAFHPNFDDAVAVQRVLDAVERSAQSRNWVRVS